MNAARDAAVHDRWVVFALGAQRFALSLDAVMRIVRATEITPLPLAPEPVSGAIDVGGDILPVFNLRRRLHLPGRPLALSDQFILARTARRGVVLLVDRVEGITDAPVRPLDGSGRSRGALALPDGLVLIEDLEEFLSPDEDAALDRALSQAEVRVAR